jgi:hypothetical protein
MNWLKQLFSRRRLYNDLSDEMRAHLEEKVEELVAGGMPRKEAIAAARREFGNVTLAEEDSRAVWRWPSLEDFFMDIRYGARMLRQNPAFTAVAVLTLALGIGANTAIFSVVNGVLVKPLPFPKQDQLLMLWEKDKDGLRSNTSWATYMDWNRENHSFTGIAAISLWTPTIVTANDAENLIGFRVSSTFFDVMGMKPELGRGFLPSEDVRGNNFVVVLSQGFWQRRLGSDPNILGKSIQLGNRAYTVVGILPAQFPSVLSFDPRKPTSTRPWPTTHRSPTRVATAVISVPLLA